MPNKYSEMDTWSEEEALIFKEEGEDDSNLTPSEFPSARALGVRRKNVKVVCEGDSWTNYKIDLDLVDCLRWFHGYRIKNFGKPGDTLENMIYGTEVNHRYRRVAPQIKMVLNRIERVQPEVFIFSGGGNDIAGNEFISFLHHADSNLGVLKEPHSTETIRQTFKKYYQDLIDKVLAASPSTHIFTHGYGYARPTGEGIGILGLDFIGPWLKPALGRKGIDDNIGKRAIESLIDHFNEMLSELDNEIDQFHHCDLRTVIRDDDWRDELHLKRSAFRVASDVFNNKIIEVFPDIG